MKKLAFITIAALLTAVSSSAQDKQPFWLGADISGTTQLESRGRQLRNAIGEPRENTALMKELGLNAVRLRVWVNPGHGGFCDMHDVLRMALRAKALDMPVMIDFHYSDWWADPGHQDIPKAWAEMGYEQMCDALATHTRQTLQLLRDNDIDVPWVQVGNETTHGFLWPLGRAETNMAQYAGLTHAGYDAVKAVYPDASVIIHLDGGCDPKRYHFIFEGLKQYGCPWDMIGMSVYPYWDMQAGLSHSWQETVDLFVDNANQLYQQYQTPLMVVETGAECEYPQDGKRILSAIIRAARERTGGHCHGVFYWAPELEGHYKLGAFHHGMPTVIMDAFSEW